jgi:hypothetical protein
MHVQEELKRRLSSRSGSGGKLKRRGGTYVCVQMWTLTDSWGLWDAWASVNASGAFLRSCVEGASRTFRVPFRIFITPPPL